MTEKTDTEDVKKERPRVYTAEPYRWGAMGSLGNASMMFIAQHGFPDTYDEREKITGADSDRCLLWDYEHARRAFKEHTGTGDQGLENWAVRAAPSAVLAFIIDVLKADTSMKWTGWRVLGSVHRGNDYAVYSMQLFAKHPESKKKVYSGPAAPNVKRSIGGRDDSLNYMGGFQ